MLNSNTKILDGIMTLTFQTKLYSTTCCSLAKNFDWGGGPKSKKFVTLFR